MKVVLTVCEGVAFTAVSNIAFWNSAGVASIRGDTARLDWEDEDVVDVGVGEVVIVNSCQADEDVELGVEEEEDDDDEVVLLVVLAGLPGPGSNKITFACIDALVTFTVNS